MMDVDNDIEGQLLQQFSCMGTQDKEVLIAQFQHFLGNQINPENCAFYLDMNNWYEQNFRDEELAICYDLDHIMTFCTCIRLFSVEIFFYESPAVKKLNVFFIASYNNYSQIKHETFASNFYYYVDNTFINNCLLSIKCPESMFHLESRC